MPEFRPPDEPVRAPRIEPMEQSAGKKKLAAIIGTTAVAGLIAVVGMFEGKSNDPYLDIVNVPTVCFGETRVEMRHYTDAECDDMLAEGLADFAKPVLERNPTLKGHDAQLIAATSLAYNIGAAAYARSTVAKRFSAGDWKGACDAFLMWAKAGGREVKGLRVRREKERAICLRGL
jgi:lysozyme